MAKGGTSYTYKERLHEKPIFHITMFLLLVATLTVSIFSLVKTNNITGNVVSESVSIDDFLQKLTVHDELKNYAGVAPLNVVQINANNLGNLQSQIAGLDTSYLGDFIVQYNDLIAVYDYENDVVKNTISLQQQQTLPADFFSKLNKHPELSGLKNEQPVGGPLDASSLESLQQDFPEVYANAKVGDYLLRYTTKLVIYDYNNDRIVNIVNLKQ